MHRGFEHEAVELPAAADIGGWEVLELLVDVFDFRLEVLRQEPTPTDLHTVDRHVRGEPRKATLDHVISTGEVELVVEESVDNGVFPLEPAELRDAVRGALTNR